MHISRLIQTKHTQNDKKHIARLFFLRVIKLTSAALIEVADAALIFPATNVDTNKVKDVPNFIVILFVVAGFFCLLKVGFQIFVSTSFLFPRESPKKELKRHLLLTSY